MAEIKVSNIMPAFSNEKVDGIKLGFGWSPVDFAFGEGFAFVFFCGSRVLFVIKKGFELNASKKLSNLALNSFDFFWRGTKFKPLERTDFSAAVSGRSDGMVTTVFGGLRVLVEGLNGVKR